VVSAAPAGSILVYATSAGKTAADGNGRNGLFTGQLLKNLPAKGIEVKEVFNRTGSDVLTVSDGEQFPELSIKFFGNAYLNGQGDNPAPYFPTPVVTPVVNPPHNNNDKNYSPDDFGGVWNGTLSYTQNGASYRDTYTISFYEDSICEITIKAQDGTTQTTEGYWSAENNTFNLDADFYSGNIARLNSIKWISRYLFEGNKRRLNINIKPAPDYSGVVRLTLNKGR
jgi:hypothetical protein